ncbi:MAG: VWA domain-containing protein [Bacteroidota bacterium]
MKRLHFISIIALILILNACSYSDLASPSFPAYNYSGDQYNDYGENPFIEVAKFPVSTFSVDADGASYANTRRFILDDHQIPPIGAVRTEEFLNYFQLDYPFTDFSHPINLNGEVSTCPWSEDHKLVRIGIQGKPLSSDQMPNSNFVLLIDVSGSMSNPDKLDLLKNGFKKFVDAMRNEDRIAIVTYAGSSEVILPSTPGHQKTAIKDAIDELGAGGSTAGAEGITTAYEIAEAHFIEGGNNRIIMGTDGDFNVGISSQEELVELIEAKRERGVFLTVLGVGRGNLNDATLEQIANKGNGTYEYIDNVRQLKKVFLYDFGKFFTVAKDVKVQVEFNAENVASYRLIGYENRLLSQDAFEDDSEDAGEIGANQNITAIYEIVPLNNPEHSSDPTFSIDFRYKYPQEENSLEMELPIFDEGNSFSASSDQMKFTASVAAFSMLLSDSEYKGNSTYNRVLMWLDECNLPDQHGFKSELIEIVEEAKDL